MTMPGDITISILPSVDKAAPSDVNPREHLMARIEAWATANRWFTYRTDNRRDGTTHIEITAHERTAPIEIDDQDTLALLEFVAQGQGVTVMQLLKDAAKAANEERKD